MRIALVAANAVVCLPELWHRTVVADKECSACFFVVCGLLGFWNVAMVDALVVVDKNGRDVQSVRARHAIFTVVARYGWVRVI